MDTAVTAVGDDRNADDGYRKKYGAKSTGPLTFSIARIMEPDVRTRLPAAPTADYFHALESAFKKYVPAADGHPARPTTVLLPSGVRVVPAPYPPPPVVTAPRPFHYQQRVAGVPQQPCRDGPRRSRPAATRMPPSRPETASCEPVVPSPSSTRPPAQTPIAKEPTSAATKTFTCNHCGKVFFAHYNLTRHMPVHTGARPFICKVRARLRLYFSYGREEGGWWFRPANEFSGRSHCVCAPPLMVFQNTII